MLRNILWVVAVIALVIGGIFLYQQMTGRSVLGDGAITWHTPKPDTDTAANTNIDNQPVDEAATTTFDRNAPPAGGVSNQPPPAAKAPIARDNGGMTTPATPTGSMQSGSMQSGSMQSGSMPANLPAGDSQGANAPNGVAFAGSGRFQWYRQGNITYRVDTQSGSTCVAFATNSEWRKTEVIRRGCNSQS